MKKHNKKSWKISKSIKHVTDRLKHIKSVQSGNRDQTVEEEIGFSLIAILSSFNQTILCAMQRFGGKVCSRVPKLNDF